MTQKQMKYVKSSCKRLRSMPFESLAHLSCLHYSSDNNATKREGKMILNHCVSLLTTGRSEFRQAEFDDHEKVLFKLVSGVRAKRLDSLKTALVMIEIMKISTSFTSQEEQFKRFDNFVEYVFAQFSEPLAMALVKYAINDRKIEIKKLTKAPSFQRVKMVFKPVMLDKSKDPKEVRKYARFEQLHKRLTNMVPMSMALAHYVEHECEVLA